MIASLFFVRSASVRSRIAATDEQVVIMLEKTGGLTLTSRVLLSARTLALCGLPVSSDISPKKPPLPAVASTI
jgi:hypothetical protein